MDGPIDSSNQPDLDKAVRLRACGGVGWAVPRSPPRLAEEQSEWRAARSAKAARPERIWLRRSRRRAAAAARVVAEMTRPSGSFQEALRREPSCLMRMCDARTVSPTADDMVSLPPRSRFGLTGCVRWRQFCKTKESSPCRVACIGRRDISLRIIFLFSNFDYNLN
jgi:hypothetical protein